MPALFLDLDGVLADFDAGVETLLGMSAAAYEKKRSKRDFWFRLMRADDFYGSLNDEQKAQFEAVGQERDTTVGQASEQRSDSPPRYRRRGFGSVEGMIRHFIAIAR